MAHLCPAVACMKMIPPRKFMCGGHWEPVPPHVRMKIMDEYPDWLPGRWDDVFKRQGPMFAALYLAVAHAAVADGKMNPYEAAEYVRRACRKDGYFPPDLKELFSKH